MLPTQSIPRNTAKSCGSSTGPWSPFHRPACHTHCQHLSADALWSPFVTPCTVLNTQSQSAPLFLSFHSFLTLAAAHHDSHFLPAPHAHIKTSTAFTAVSQEKRAWQLCPLYFLPLQLSVLMLSLPQAVLHEILVVIKEKSKVILKRLGKRTNINHILSTFGSTQKANYM